MTHRQRRPIDASAPVFVDTNVLIYAVDSGDPAKQALARQWRAELWESRRGRVSFQVLHEFFVKVTRKSPAAREQARHEVRDLLAWKPVPVNELVLDDAWRIQDRYALSFWDALIVAAAKSQGCRYLLTEDLQDHQELDRVLVVNPFLHSPTRGF